MFELQAKNPIPTIDGARYRGIAYDGCHIYLTMHCVCSIVQLDNCFRKTACFTTCRDYAAICYDKCSDCFWATADEHPSIIYKLNKCMEEIDRIKVKGSKWCCTPITGLSYSCCDHSLVVAFADEVIRVWPNCPEKQVCILKARRGLFLRVLSMCPYLLCYCLEGTIISVCLYSDCGKLLYKAILPCNAGIESAIFWPCVKEDCKCHILVLRTKHGCYPYLCDFTLNCDDICSTLCCCNYDLCHQCHNPNPCGDACTDVLESIALVEASLAHILNAEGEKIQKIVASTDDIHEIMAVNESVNETLSKVIFLEQVLSCKLENLKKCCDFCEQSELCE